VKAQCSDGIYIITISATLITNRKPGGYGDAPIIGTSVAARLRQKGPIIGVDLFQNFLFHLPSLFP